MGRPQKLSKSEDLPLFIKHSKLSGQRLVDMKDEITYFPLTVVAAKVNLNRLL